ncbi:hypothetical protein ACFWB0_23945 [Rhodococcus sp. NPDC060086]|uniref:hypothetical protein n=1 Tax=Rhodococcus sp. NPDC060086 TaxID=3347055 RepID=UPI00365C99D0
MQDPTLIEENSHVLPRHLLELRKNRMGWMRTACRRGHAFRARRRSLYLRPGHRPGHRRTPHLAFAVPALTIAAHAMSIRRLIVAVEAVISGPETGS